MSVARWLREFGGLGLSLLASVAGWLLIAPIAALVPKRRDWVAVIGRQHGKFLDNAKHFYLQATAEAPDLQLVFITERSDTFTLLTSAQARVLRYPGPGAIWFLLHCGSTVVDSTDWERHLRRFLLIRARVVQLWHGVAFKRIEMDKWRHETGRYRWFSQGWVFALRMAFYRFTGRIVRYAAVACTSRFYRDEVFRPAFLARHFPVTGYPRNAFARMGNDVSDARWANVDAAIRARLPEWRAAHRRLVLVTPTSRDSGATPMQLDAEAIRALDAFADAHAVEFVFKFHPSERGAGHVTGRHLHACSPDSDLYPLMPHAQALITDYSSIYTDFLQLDRPVLFLIPDGDGYMQRDREVQFDPATMMPGPVAAAWPELLVELTAQWANDSRVEDRHRLYAQAFDGLDQSTATTRLLDCMRSEGWLPVSPSSQAHTDRGTSR